MSTTLRLNIWWVHSTVDLPHLKLWGQGHPPPPRSTPLDSLCFLASAADNRWREASVLGRPSVRPFVHFVSRLLTAIPRDTISVRLVKGFQMKLGKSDHHLSGYCWKDFQGQRSEVYFCGGGFISAVSLRLTSLYLCSEAVTLVQETHQEMR